MCEDPREWELVPDRRGSRPGFSFDTYVSLFTPRLDSTELGKSFQELTNLQYQLSCNAGRYDCQAVERDLPFIKPSHGHDALVQFVLHHRKTKIKTVMPRPRWKWNRIWPVLSLAFACVLSLFRLRRALLPGSLAPCVSPLKGRFGRALIQLRFTVCSEVC